MTREELDIILPPPKTKAVYAVGAAGTALCFAAMIVGFLTDSGPGFVSTLRLLLVAAGCVTAGAAVSMRATLPIVWLLSAICFTMSWFGLPAHWDSARIVAFVAAGFSLAAAVIVVLPGTFRAAVLTAVAIWHFGGIFCATTWPDPAPWTTQQIGGRVYLPYLMFMYLRNAYHFYSPEPGPASHIFALVTYDTIDPITRKPKAEWHTLPNRREHMKDPMGLAYYRRLSITEQAAQTMPPLGFTFEQPKVVENRLRAAGTMGGFPHSAKIPLAPDEFEAQSNQYRTPRPDVGRYLIPSYANHLLRKYSTPEQKAVSVKLYRLEHRVMPAIIFARGHLDPNHPTTYRPYFLGEFRSAASGKVELVDSQDPLLYWLVPILPQMVSPQDKRDFKDYMSIHAGYAYDWENRVP